MNVPTARALLFVIAMAVCAAMAYLSAQLETTAMRTKTIETTVYITDDGQEFTERTNAEIHELHLLLATLEPLQASGGEAVEPAEVFDWLMEQKPQHRVAIAKRLVQGG